MTTTPGTLVYYITAHGYGHGVRSADIIRACHELEPRWNIIATTALPRAFIQSRLHLPPENLRPGAFDVGMIQDDALTVDLSRTLEALTHQMAQREQLIAAEVEFLRSVNAGLVAADIPSIPLEAAARLDIPRVAIGNFGWNWIYAPCAERDARWKPLIERIEEGYRCAQKLYRLPFAEPMTVFSNPVDIPLLARPGKPDRQAVERLTQADPEKEWVLIAFTKLNWPPEALARIARLEDCEFFTLKPVEWPGSCVHCLDPRDIFFSDLLASVDCVISKPGFGLVSECIVNRKPLIYVEREHFPEYEILATCIHRHLPAVCITQQQLYSGSLEAALQAIETTPHPDIPHETGGSRKLAEYLLADTRTHCSAASSNTPRTPPPTCSMTALSDEHDQTAQLRQSLREL